MRRRFGELIAKAVEHPSVRLLAGDVGFGVLDAAFRSAPDRCWNMGASEQAMIGAAVGMTYEGLIPVCYTITPFLLYRPFEWLRNYVQTEGAPIKLVGSGRDKDYLDAGYTHWCEEQLRVLSCLPRIRVFYPASVERLDEVWDDFLHSPEPCYLSLSRK